MHANQHVYEEQVPILQLVAGAESAGIVNFDARQKKKVIHDNKRKWK